MNSRRGTLSVGLRAGLCSALFLVAPARADTVTADFSTSHDYKVNGVAGTIWDGFFYNGDQAARTFLCTRSPETGWLHSIRRVEDPGRVEFIRPGQTLGPVKLRVRTPGTPWRDVSQGDSGVELRSRFVPRGETLRWEITVKNTDSGKALEIGDLALPLPMNADYVADSEETYLRRVFRHALIAGHGSFLICGRVYAAAGILRHGTAGNAHQETRRVHCEEPAAS